MTLYQELQLSSVGSKQLIHSTTDKKEKRRHILIYNFKVYLVMAFCVALVTLYSKLTGNENSVVGVTVLLALLVLRQADFGIQTKHGLISIAGIFMILMVGPRLANILPVFGTFAVNIVCIFLLMILGCHNVIMYNHSTFVLGYLLLYGYDVSGESYRMRVVGLAVGMAVCMAVFYKNQKNRPYRRTFVDLFREFDIHSARNIWYIKLTFIVSSAMLIVTLLGLPRAMWAGIADREQAKRMVEENYLCERTFNAPYGVRTLSKCEKMYQIVKSGNPSCWLGPIWGVANYMTYRGLLKYGYSELADELAEKTLKLFGDDIAECGEMHEYYDPETGRGVNNQGFQSWNLLCVNIIARKKTGTAVEEF